MKPAIISTATKPTNINQQQPTALPSSSSSSNVKLISIAQPQKQDLTSLIETHLHSNINNSFVDSLKARLFHSSNQQYVKETRKFSLKLLDENFLFNESTELNEYLIDTNTEFLVVGVLGKRGCGKTTLISKLAGLDHQFECLQQEKEFDSKCEHKTKGIDLFISQSNRTIYLDCQPLMSCSLLDKSVQIDKLSGNNTNSSSNNNDFKYYENLIEIQSIELICFIMSICVCYSYGRLVF
jgi:hypothetical protein